MAASSKSASLSKTLTKILLPTTTTTTTSSTVAITTSVPGKCFSFSTSAPAALSSLPQDTTPPPASQPLDQEKVSKWSKLFLFVPGAITFGLGTWQIFRREEKIKMLEYRQNRLGMEPITCNQVAPSSENLDSLEFRKVMCKGIFDEKQSVFVGPRSRSISGVTENGYYVITPLVPIPNNTESMQSPILVNRGWVPRSWRDESLKVAEHDDLHSKIEPALAQDSERSSWWKLWSTKPIVVEDQAPTVTPIEVVGVVRGSEKPSIFVPANDPRSSQWFYVDVPAIAHACGLPENTIYIEAVNENVNPSKPYPIPKDTTTLIRSSVMPQDHLNYMITWYSLSAAVTFMAFKRLKPKKSHR